MKFSRRLAFLAPLVALLPGCLTVVKTAPPSYHSEWGLGKYIRHYCYNSYDIPPLSDNANNYLAYPSFPYETTLVVVFEKGIEQYTGFNGCKEVLSNINNNNYEYLLKHYKKDPVDCFSGLYELTDSKGRCKIRLRLSGTSFNEAKIS